MPRSFREAPFAARSPFRGAGHCEVPSTAHVTMRRGVFLAMTAMLLGFGACTAGSLGYLLLRDEALHALGARHAKIERSQEEHVASLRRELEMVNSQRVLEGAALEARVRELSARQAQIETRASLLAALATGGDLPTGSTQTSKSPRTTPHAAMPGGPPAASTGALGFAPAPRAQGSSRARRAAEGRPQGRRTRPSRPGGGAGPPSPAGRVHPRGSPGRRTRSDAVRRATSPPS